MFTKILSLFAVVLLVAACGDDPETQVETTPPAPAAASGPADGSMQHWEINVPDTVNFGYDRSDLNTQARSILDIQAEWLRRNAGVAITVEGHADERGTREYNLALGDRRASSVRNYLVAQGIDPSRITTISYGKERPIAVGSNESAWAQNRRGVSVITSGAPIN